MASNLSDFRRITGGFAKACYFNMVFGDLQSLRQSDEVPKRKFSSLGTATANELHMFASSATLPARTLETQNLSIQYGLPGISIASKVTYAPWTVTFYGDSLMKYRKIFLEWQYLVINTSNHTYTTPSRYKSHQTSVTLLNGENKAIQTINFEGLFPTNVGEVSLQQQDFNIVTFDVTFNYDYFNVNNYRNRGFSDAIETIPGKSPEGNKYVATQSRSGFADKPRNQ
jgi:hypothetical protein